MEAFTRALLNPEHFSGLELLLERLGIALRQLSAGMEKGKSDAAAGSQTCLWVSVPCTIKKKIILKEKPLWDSFSA